MAFFTDTINKQIATQLNVADQIARQKQMDVDNSIKMYYLGKKYDDERLTGQATRGMMNQGLISGLFTQGMDGLRGLAQRVGADVKGVERHNPVVDATLTNDLMPNLEENEGEAANYLRGAQRYASGNIEDKVRAKAAQAYADAGLGFDEERFRKDFMLSNGKIKAKENLPDHIRDQYLKTEKEFNQLSGQANNRELKEEVGLREHMKKRGIDKIKNFSGSHSNMRNQNYKIHKDLVDYYVKNNNWEKAQEIQDVYIQNEMNIDKHWGMGGKREYGSLFKRPTGKGVSTKTENKGFTVGGQLYTVDLRPGESLDPNIIMKRLKAGNPAGYEAYKAALERGEKINIIDTDKSDRANLPHEDDNLEQKEIKALEDKRNEGWHIGGSFRVGSKDAQVNRSAAFTGQRQLYVDGALKNKSMLTGRDVAKIASGIGHDPLELALSLSEQTRKPLVQFLDARTKRDAIAAGIIDNQGRPMSAGY